MIAQRQTAGRRSADSRAFLENDWCIRLFFIALCFQCACRTAGFMLSPFYLGCKRSLVGDGPVWLDVLVNSPAALDITTFSMLVRAFATSYHAIMKEGEGAHRRLHKCVMALVVFVNVGSYVLLGASFVSFSLGKSNAPGSQFFMVAVFTICIASLIMGVIFMAYGTVIVATYRRLLTIAPSFDDDAMLDVAGGGAPEAAGSPLLRMTLIAAVCSVCFIFRSVLLIADFAFSFDVQSRVPSSSTYFIACEVIPSCLMLYFFRTQIPTLDPSHKLLESEGSSRYLSEGDIYDRVSSAQSVVAGSVGARGQSIWDDFADPPPGSQH